MSNQNNPTPTPTEVQIRAYAEEAMQAAFAVLCERLDPDARHDLGGFFGYHCEPLSERIEAHLLNAAELAVQGAFPSPIDARLTACASWISEYIRKVDREGYCQIEADIECLRTDADAMDLAYVALRSRWQVDILEESGTSHDPVKTENLEDRENALAVIERAQAFGVEAFAGEFMRLAPYILRNTQSA